MRDPLSRDFSAFQPSQDSWLHRVRENFRQLLMPTRIFPSSANGAPIHFLRQEKSLRTGQAQGFSALAHCAIILAIALLALRAPKIVTARIPPGDKEPGIISVPSSLFSKLLGQNPHGGTSSGQGHDQLPPTPGNPLPISSIQFLKPTIPQNQHPELPLPPSILDPSAPRTLTVVNEIGLPGMPDKNNSTGRGKSNSIGEGDDQGGMGNIPGQGVGVGGPPGFYRPGITSPKCAYCPDPQYTDEAREAKLQGHVLLQVLVGADGRAAEVRIVQGIGLGLDERAAQTIRGWKFIPAYDAARRPVPSWVTVEAVFRLF